MKLEAIFDKACALKIARKKRGDEGRIVFFAPKSRWPQIKRAFPSARIEKP